MAPTRRFVRRRFPVRRRFVRRNIRRFPMRRFPRAVRKSPIYSYKQTIELPPVVLPTTANQVFFARDFQLANVIQNSTSLIDLYDSYRLMAVKFTMYPQYNTYNANVAAVDIPEIYLVVDYNDSTTPTSLSDLFAYQNLKRRAGTRPVSRYFKPRAQVNGIVTDSGTALMQVAHRAWFSTSNADVQYFAIKGAVSNSINSTVQMVFRVVCTYYLQFKNVK